MTNSLFTGLMHFRCSDHPCVLWANAVCINQTDAAEKSGQVPLIPDICLQAMCVLVWLGFTNDPLCGSMPPGVAASILQALQLLSDFDPKNAAEMAAKSQAPRHDSLRLRQEGKPGRFSSSFFNHGIP